MNNRQATALTVLVLGCPLLFGPVMVAEDGYSNYVPGFYGDLSLAIEPPEGPSLPTIYKQSHKETTLL
jgi:hypothetical protein